MRVLFNAIIQYCSKVIFFFSFLQMNDFTAGFKSEQGTGEFNGFQACLAALSAASLPLIPTYAGTLLNKM